MFDQDLMDKVLKILIKVRAAKRTLEIIENANSDIFITLESNANEVKSKSHYFMEFINFEPQFVESIEGLDSDARLWDTVDNFAAIYVIPDKENLIIDEDALEIGLLINTRKTKNQILQAIEVADVMGVSKKNTVEKDLKLAKYKIKVLEQEIKRTR